MIMLTVSYTVTDMFSPMWKESGGRGHEPPLAIVHNTHDIDTC